MHALNLLAKSYGKEFTSTQSRRAVAVGDLAAFAAAILWAEENEIDIVVKCSRRFIINKPWVTGLRALMVNSGYATASAPCARFKFGFRSELVAMHVPSWRASGAYEQMAEAVRKNVPYDGLPEAWYHHRAREVHRYAHYPDPNTSHYDDVNHPDCDMLIASEIAFPRPDGYAAFAWWMDVMGVARTQPIQGVLWHDLATEWDYWRLSEEFGLSYELDEFKVEPGT